jgi:uncharacterized protein YerC
MIRELDRHRIGKARLLRRQGKTYNEIRAVVGAVDAKTLDWWLPGIPRPNATYRSAPKTELRREVRRLRSEGLTHTEIIEKTGASVGSVSLWLRDVKVPARVEERRREHIRSLRNTGGRAVHEAAVRRRRDRIELARRSLREVSARDLFMLGVALYWAEGAKDKPWRRHGQVKFTNSDPSVMRVFLAWLDLVGVARSQRRYRLSIHESCDVAKQQEWWTTQLGLAGDQFAKPMLKRHNANPKRHNVNETYHGCLVVSVLGTPAVLYDAIDGWWQALSDALALSGIGPGATGTSNLGFDPSRVV